MKKQKVTIRDITASLQTIGHEGYADCEVFIKRLDGVYDVGKIKPYETPNGKTFFVIEAESFE